MGMGQEEMKTEQWDTGGLMTGREGLWGISELLWGMPGEVDSGPNHAPIELVYNRPFSYGHGAHSGRGWGGEKYGKGYSHGTGEGRIVGNDDGSYGNP